MLVAWAASAWRPRTPDGRTLEHPASADLDPAARRAAFEESLAMRVLEAALGADDDGAGRRRARRGRMIAMSTLDGC